MYLEDGWFEKIPFVCTDFFFLLFSFLFFFLNSHPSDMKPLVICCL